MAPTAASPQSGAPAGSSAHGAAKTTISAAGLQSDLPEGHMQASALSSAAVGIPVYFPRMIAAATQYETPVAGEYPRAYSIGHYPSYRIVLVFNALLGQYYGVQGTAWNNAPILSHPTETRIVNGRRLELNFDGHK